MQRLVIRLLDDNDNDDAREKSISHRRPEGALGNNNYDDDDDEDERNLFQRCFSHLSLSRPLEKHNQPENIMKNENEEEEENPLFIIQI
jgi:hypothetical protein